MFSDALKKMEHDYSVRVGQLEQLKTDETRLQEELVTDQANIDEQEMLRQLYQKASEEARLIYVKQLEDLVTQALQSVFGPDYKFVIEVKETRGKPEVEFYVDSLQDGQIVHAEPEESRGGGVVDIVSLALRMAVLQLYHDPKLNGPLILDEPGKHVSTNYAVELAGFMKDCTTAFNRQTIMVTHQPYFSAIADNTHEVSLVAGKSVVINKQEVNELFTASS